MRQLSTLIVLIVGLVAGYAASHYVVNPQPAMVAAPEATAPTEPAEPAEAAVRLKMASAYAGTTPMVGELIFRFNDNVAVMSDGGIEIKYYEPGALVPPLEIFDAVASGSVDMGYATPGFWAGKVPALQLFAAVPFGPASAEYMAWMYFGGGQAIYDDLYAKNNIKGLPCGLFPPEASGWFRKEIKSVDDLKGLKMRFFALGARVMEKLGVSTQLLAGGDIFPALELGTIDATEYASPAIDQGLGFYQIAKHYYFPGWHQQSTWVDVIFNLDKWNALSPRQQLLLSIACGDSVRESIAMGEARQVPAIAFLKEKGVEFHQWPQEILDAYSAAWDEVVAEEAAKDADFARAWASLTTFRESYATWKELGYLK